LRITPPKHPTNWPKGYAIHICVEECLSCEFS
jgi:hypothetical protein